MTYIFSSRHCFVKSVFYLCCRHLRVYTLISVDYLCSCCKRSVDYLVAKRFASICGLSLLSSPKSFIIIFTFVKKGLISFLVNYLYCCEQRVDIFDVNYFYCCQLCQQRVDIFVSKLSLLLSRKGLYLCL